MGNNIFVVVDKYFLWVGCKKIIMIFVINFGCLKLIEIRINCVKENMRIICNKIFKGVFKYLKFFYFLYVLSVRELERSCKCWKVYILLVLRVEK